MQTRAKSGISKPKLCLTSSSSLSTNSIPTCFSQAIKVDTWRQAMIEEYNALVHNHTWTLVPSLSQHKPVGCKWVFKIKHNADGSISRYKARLVAKGFHQLQGIDFTETFCPVAKPITIRVLLSLAASYNWAVTQLDVSNAFLHGTLQEEVYMCQPPGFVDPAHPNHICKLHKSLYGLKQAPRAWYQALHDYLLSTGFIASNADHSLFIRRHSGTLTYLLVYVDDILLTGNSLSTCNNIFTLLNRHFAIKNLGPVHYFLGLQITHTSQGLFINQEKYATELLNKASMLDANPCPTPCLPTYKLSNHIGTPLSPEQTTLYRSLAGGLQYLTWSRPDISFAVNQICQFLHCPKTPHFQALKRLLRFIKGTVSYGLLYKRSSSHITAFCDSDWVGSYDDRRSTTGFCFFLGSNLINWYVKKQHTVARSSTEAEYRSLESTAAEMSWLCQLFRDLHQPIPTCPTVWIDNISAMSLAMNPVFHARTKHIEVDYHFVRELVTRKLLNLQYVHTMDQVADIFTKALSPTRFKILQHKLSVRPLSLEGV